MNMVDAILENLNPLEILQHYGFRNITEGELEIRACCEIHKGNNPTAFVWNKENNLWFCYTGDCNGGDVFTLVEKLENINFPCAVRKVAEILGIDISDMTVTSRPDRIKREHLKWIESQKAKLKYRGHKEYILQNTKYYNECATFDRFKPETLKHFESAFCKFYPLESTMVYNKLVIPIHHNNTLVGVALRDTTGMILPKWLFQPRQLQVGKTLYNLDRAMSYIEDKNEVIVVEGIFDVWAFHEIGIQNVVAIFGSTIKSEQYKMLLQLSVTVTLCFDNDASGRKCTENAIPKFKNKTDVKLIELPESKDPADCSQEELLNAYLKRTICAGVKNH